MYLESQHHSSEAEPAVASPQLPFAGSFRPHHGRSGPARPLHDIGEQLSMAWRNGSCEFNDLLLHPREVLAVAAELIDADLSEALALVGSHLAMVGDVEAQSMTQMLAEIARFTQYLAVKGVNRLAEVSEQHCRDFMEHAVRARSGGWTEPSDSTMHKRRTAIRLLYGAARHIYLTDRDPTLDIKLPTRTTRRARSLTNEEEALGRIWSQPTLTDTRHPAAWALGQASATSSELAVAVVGDLDLPGQRVWLHGNERNRIPRWGALTDWGVRQIEAHIQQIGTDPTTPIVTRARKTRNAAQASSTMAVSDVLKRSGLSNEKDVRPLSLSAWAGRRVFEETGRIDAAAHAMGVRRLDTAAEMIGWDWDTAPGAERSDER